MSNLHFDWITIPAGDCWIGSDPAQDELALLCEWPRHQLYLTTYQLARVLVTVAQLAAFVQATAITPLLSRKATVGASMPPAGLPSKGQPGSAPRAGKMKPLIR